MSRTYLSLYNHLQPLSSHTPSVLLNYLVFLLDVLLFLTSMPVLWCWEGLGARGEGDDRGWDGWMASLTRWTWVWVNSGSWWWTGRPGVLRFMGLQRVGHDWATDLIWSDACDHVVSSVWKALHFLFHPGKSYSSSGVASWRLEGFFLWANTICWWNGWEREEMKWIQGFGLRN